MKLNEANPAMAVIHAEVRAADRRFLVRADGSGSAQLRAVDDVHLVRGGPFVWPDPILIVAVCTPKPCGGFNTTSLHVFGQN